MQLENQPLVTIPFQENSFSHHEAVKAIYPWEYWNMVLVTDVLPDVNLHG